MKCWYVAATADELDNSPVGRRILGVDIVLWRAPRAGHGLREPVRASGIPDVAQHHRR